ncbi:MAG: hypothetical protein JWO38_1463 [Gemmataceae bacterium]|nr:hypothetical protein [Gemmataceae bacterium]
MSTVSVEHIEKTPDTCGGRARIAGHSIRVMDIVALHEHGPMSPAEIARQYPTITLADVYAALAYYHDHRDEIEADFADARKWDEYGKTQPSKLRDKLKAREAGGG